LPIIDQALWDAVYAIFAINARTRTHQTRATVECLLHGIVFGNDGRTLMPVSASSNATAAPTDLQAALARGHRWLRQIESGKVPNISAIAKAESVDRRYISRMINLTTLAPDIQAAILNEILPDTVSLPATRRCRGRCRGGGLIEVRQCRALRSDRDFQRRYTRPGRNRG